ncbi:hypothetical protein L218DRAFT_1003248 [Marasmius fiardii PR-910]|nr:hypothetical protein L218DRAFT_1003248 [Marasmius fiardii PR-910]
MYSFKSLFLLLPLLARYIQVAAVPDETTAATDASFAPNTIAYADINPVDQIVTVQGTNNRPGFVIYQDASSGDLVAVGMSDTFATGVRTTRQTIVPSADILWGSPLSLTSWIPSANDVGVVEVFYFGPDYLVKEVLWENQWFSEASCPFCIQKELVFRAVPGSRVLSGLASPTGAHAHIRLIFQSVDHPNRTVVEAQRNAGQSWTGLYPFKD